MITTMKPKLGITLFEDQLIRNYVISDNGSFIKSLHEKYELVFFTGQANVDKLNRILQNIDKELCIVRKVPVISESRITRLFGFILRWSLPDTGTRVAMGLYREKRQHNFMGYVIRYILWRLSPFTLRLLPLMRYLYSTAALLKLKKIDSFQYVKDLDFLFATSLTNLCEDLPLCIIAGSRGIKILGSVRSWDNLSIHGLLRWIPNKFISHSPYMSSNLHNKHRVKKSIISEIGSPMYRLEFLPKNFEKLQSPRVLFACSGLRSNPDELHLLDYLINKYTELESSVDLFILQHPASPHKHLDELISNSNITISTFHYLTTSLAEYYNFLSSMDLILCSGTTVALDALFTSTPVNSINFEINKVSYWNSALRAFDSRPHTRDFFSHYQIPKIVSKEDMIENLIRNENKRNRISLNNLDLTLFLGNNTYDFISLFKHEIENITK